MDPIMFHTVVGVSSGETFETPAGLYPWNFGDTTRWSAGDFEGQDDQFGNTFDHEATASDNAFALETNDGSQMLAVNQQNANGGNKGYLYSAVPAGQAKLKFRMLVDVPSSDTGHSIRFTLVGGSYLIFKILGNGIIQCQIASNTRINQSGLTPGNLTVMGYLTGTVAYMKAKNGHDAAMSWTTWNGTDADAFGSYTETYNPSGNSWSLGAGNDTAPLTHGWVKSFEIMVPSYSGWTD